MGNAEGKVGAADTRIGDNFETARKLLTEDELKRLETTFKFSNGNKMSLLMFNNQLFTPNAPSSVIQELFECIEYWHGEGITFDKFVIFITVLTKGSAKNRTEYFIKRPPKEPDVRYVKMGNGSIAQRDCVLPDGWIDNPPRLTSDADVARSSHLYDILSGVTHLSQEEISDLDKCLNLVDPRYCRVDIDQFSRLVSPPVPAELVKGFFRAFDENADGAIDFKEFVCGLSASSRGPKIERLKFLFKIWDEDCDGKLRNEDMRKMYRQLAYRDFNRDIENNYIENIRFEQDNCVTVAEFMDWLNKTRIADDFVNIIEEVAHICFGLRPENIDHERLLVRKFRERLDFPTCDSYVVISNNWWNQWAYSADDARMPPIDNSDLIAERKDKLPSFTEEGAVLRSNLVENKDYVTVAPVIYDALVRWHTTTTPRLTRLVRPPTKSTELQQELDLYPITLTVLRHQVNASFAQISQITSAFKATLAKTQDALSAFPAPRRIPECTVTFPKWAKIGQLCSLLCQKFRQEPENARVWMLIPNTNDMLLLGDDGTALEELAMMTGTQILFEVRNNDQTWPEELNQLKSSKNHYNLDLRLQASEQGVTGLNNLGNTCYMNSAIQCCSNVRPLTDFLLDDERFAALSRQRDSFLTQEYASLIKDLWSGKSRVIAPMKFRNTFTRRVTRFKDACQHDCGEFLAELLDLLHEELNDVDKKTVAYRELQDSDGRPDAVVAAEAWSHHLSRNRSVIVDLFVGLLRSRVRCDECGYDSVRFDPFSFLQLPLPAEDLYLFVVAVIRQDGSTPTRYAVRMAPVKWVRDLLVQVAKLAGLPADTNLTMLILERTGEVVKQCVSNHDQVKTLAGDLLLLYAYELPTCTTRENGDSLVGLSDVTLDSADDEQSNLTVTKTNGQLGPKSMSVDSANVNSHIVRYDAIWAGATRIAEDDDEWQNRIGKYLVAIHRRTDYSDNYFLAHSRARPTAFGLPLFVTAVPGATTQRQLYDDVHRQVRRLLDPPADRTDTAFNRAIDADEGSEYPFVLRTVLNNRKWTATRVDYRAVCAKCSWDTLCRGCVIEPLDKVIADWMTADRCVLAVDWDATALHLRYQHSLEMSCSDHPTVKSCYDAHYKPTSLQTCLADFTDEEKLDGEVHCKSCKKNTPSTKKLDIWKLPQILVINLKRFVHVNGRWLKSVRTVEFPLDGFDAAPFLISNNQTDGGPLASSEDDDIGIGATVNEGGDASTTAMSSPLSPVVYDCFAIANHHGHIGAGHYVAYAKNDGRWYCFNDSKCKAVSENELDRNSAYLLFYQRRDL